MTSQLRFGVSLRHARAEFMNRSNNLALITEVDQIVSICRRSGASAIEPLQALVHQLQEEHRDAEKIAAESAAPRATVRLVIWLPVVAFALAQLLGLPVLQVIAQSWVAKLSVAFGVALLCLGGWFSSRMLKFKPATDTRIGQLSAVVLNLSSGLSFRRSLQSVIVEQPFKTQLEQLHRSALKGGFPLAEALRLTLTELRAAERARSHLHIRELGVKLLIPLGATALPALVLLLVVPMAIGLTQTSGITHI